MQIFREVLKRRAGSYHPSPDKRSTMNSIAAVGWFPIETFKQAATLERDIASIA